MIDAKLLRRLANWTRAERIQAQDVLAAPGDVMRVRQVYRENDEIVVVGPPGHVRRFSPDDKVNLVKHAAKKIGPVYHGATARFDDIQTSYQAYFTDNLRVAIGYACGGFVLKAVLNVSNPLVVDARGNDWDSLPYTPRLRALAKKVGVDFKGYEDGTIDCDLLGELAKAAGHDVVIVKNIEDGASYAYAGQTTEYIVFSNSVIEKKSMRPVSDFEEPDDKVNLVKRAGDDKPEVATTPKKRYGVVMADLPSPSPASVALAFLRAEIEDEDLRGEGREENSHVTLRYGFSGDSTPIADYLRTLAPFDVTLGGITIFEPSKSSDGASVVVVDAESPELALINRALADHGNWKPADFDYHPHITVAYVNPETADKYRTLKTPDEATFTVEEVVISDDKKNKTIVKLEGNKKELPKAAASAIPTKNIFERVDTDTSWKTLFYQAHGAARNRNYEAPWLSVKDTPFKEIIATQEYVDTPTVEYVLRQLDEGADLPNPVAARIGGELYLSDGHHRIVAMSINLVTHYPIEIYDLDVFNSGKTAAPLHDEAKDRVFYHGTDSEPRAQTILTQGIQPREVSMPDQAKSRGFLAPAKGRVYLTTDIGYAAIYGLGAAMFGHEDPNGRLQKDRDGNPSPYGYIFAINGKDINGDVVPDEDSIGEILCDLYEYEEARSNLAKLTPDHPNFKYLTPMYERTIERGKNEPINQPDAQSVRYELQYLASRYLTARQKENLTSFEVAHQAAIGKKLQKYLSADTVRWMLDHGAHAAHTGAIHPTRAWRFLKKDAAKVKAEDVLSICEEIPVQRKTAAKKPSLRERTKHLAKKAAVVTIEDSKHTDIDGRDRNDLKLMLDGQEIGSMQTIANPDHLKIDGVFIKPEYRGKGYGVQLYRKAEEIALRRGLLEIRSSISVSSDAARVWNSIGGESFDDHGVKRWRLKVAYTLTQPEIATLKDMESRSGDTEFREWLEDLIGDDNDFQEALADEPLRVEYFNDWLREQHSVDVDEHGYVHFWKLSPEIEGLIGNLPVVVYHHTSSLVLDAVRKEGLRADAEQANPYLNSSSGVYVTTEQSGPAVDGYQRNALNSHREINQKKRQNYKGRKNFNPAWDDDGHGVSLAIKTTLSALVADPDDADISSGTHQFVLPRVAPQDIVWDETEKTAGVKTASVPMDEESFNAFVVRKFKEGAAEDNGWKSPVTIHHGTDSVTAQQIIASGYFESGKDWPSFFTLRRKEAEDYARMRVKQLRDRGKPGDPYVFSLRVAPFAVTHNKGSDEVETHTLIPLFIQGRQGFIRDEDIVKAEAEYNPTDPVSSYSAYVAAYEKGDPDALRISGEQLDGNLMVPVVQNGKVIEEKPLKDMAFYPLLSTYDYLRRKRDRKSRELLKKVEAWGMHMQSKRASVKKAMTITVKPEEEAHFWEEGPVGSDEQFWAFRWPVRATVGDKIEFKLNKQPIAEAVISRIEKPGESDCAVTGKYKSMWKVHWRNDSFRDLRKQMTS